MAAASRCAVACALLLFAATANCTVTYNSVAFGSPTRFSAMLADNGNGVCGLLGVLWPGQGGSLLLDCGSSGYTATAEFSQADENGFIQQVVTVTRPGFIGSFGPPECMFDCGCSDCVTWTGSAF